MKDHNKIKMELLENGLDFIDTSLKPILKNNNPQELKYSILHLSAGVELILKEIIKNEHWAFIFEDINKANYNDLSTGNFQSVCFETVIKRLSNITNKRIHPQTIDEIRKLRKLRNQMEHFAFEESPDALRSRVSKVLCEVLDLIKRNIDFTQYDDNIKSRFDNTRTKSFEFEEYVNLKNNKIKKEIENFKSNNVIILHCPHCFQAALPFNNELKCLFCDHHWDAKELAYDYSYCILEEEFNEDASCPKCNENSVAINNNKTLICFNCCEESDVRDYPVCRICEKILFNNEENDVCYTCLSKENPYHEKY